MTSLEYKGKMEGGGRTTLPLVVGRKNRRAEQVKMKEIQLAKNGRPLTVGGGGREDKTNQVERGWHEHGRLIRTIYGGSWEEKSESGKGVGGI